MKFPKLDHTTTHALGGGLLGGLTGVFASRNPYRSDGTKRTNKEQRSRIIRNGLLGAGLGTFAGASIGDLRDAKKFHIGQAENYKNNWYDAVDDLGAAKAEASSYRWKHQTSQQDAQWAKEDANFWKDRYHAESKARAAAEDAAHAKWKAQEDARWAREEEDFRKKWSNWNSGGSSRSTGGFSGFHADKPEWLRHAKTKAEAQAAYKAQARKHHPDMGGSHEAMTGLNNEWDKWKTKFGSALYSALFDELDKIKAARER